MSKKVQKWNRIVIFVSGETCNKYKMIEGNTNNRNDFILFHLLTSMQAMRVQRSLCDAVNAFCVNL